MTSKVETENARLKREPWLWVSAAIWLMAAATGLWAVWRWDNRPGTDANPPARWPAMTRLARAADRPTLIFLAHPHCTCTEASLGELAEVLARAPARPKTYVLFLKPKEFANGWERTDLWTRASSLPDVTVLRDDDGREARTFAVATSGQTLLYDAAGALAFSGGVTSARAHRGDNAGRASLISILTRGQADRSTTSVFGCPLFAAGS